MVHALMLFAFTIALMKFVLNKRKISTVQSFIFVIFIDVNAHAGLQHEWPCEDVERTKPTSDSFFELLLFEVHILAVVNA